MSLNSNHFADLARLVRTSYTPFINARTYHRSLETNPSHASLSSSRHSTYRLKTLAWLVLGCSSAQSLYAQELLVAAEPVLITAQRAPEQAREALVDFVLIERDALDKMGAMSVGEILQQQRGLEVARNGGAGSATSVFIRGGSNAQNIVLIDGVRIGSATTGGASWASIPASLIDRIEIVYGPLSATYGADAMTGVIQIFTRQVEKHAVLQAEAGAGSYGLSKQNAYLGIPISDTSKVMIQGSKERNRGFSATRPSAGSSSYHPDQDGYSLESINLKWNGQLSKNWELGSQYLQSHLDTQFDAGPKQDDHTLQKLRNYVFYTSYQFTDYWSSRLQAQRSDDEGYTYASYGQSFVNSQQTTWSWQNDVKWGGNKLQAFIENREESVLTSTQGMNKTRRTQSLALAFSAPIDFHNFSSQLRYDDSSQYGAQFNGGVAWGYRLGPELNVKASLGTSFRAPTFNELYYPGYGISSNQPEHGKNSEVSVNWKRDGFLVTGSVYRNRLRNLLVSTSVCPIEQATHKYGCAYNVNRAVLSGLSIGSEYQAHAWRVGGNLDIGQALDETTQLQLARRAKKHAHWFIDYSNEQYSVGFENTLSARRFDDIANKKPLGGYGLMNVYATFSVSRALQFSVRWNNITSKDYELAKNYGSAGSNIYASLKYTM